MADDTNEDSWLYGTSNPDSTTNEEERKEPDTQEQPADDKTDGEVEQEPTENGNEAEADEGRQSPDTNEPDTKDEVHIK